MQTETKILEPTPESQISHAVKQFGNQLLQFIKKKVKNEADAEDILQDVWFQFTSTINVSPVEQVGAWLYKVARNKIIDKYRKKKEETFSYLPSEEENEFNIKEILLVDSQDAETNLVKELFWEELMQALSELPPAQSQVFIWHELEDYSFEKISEITGEKVKTLISRKHYAVVYLRKRLQRLYQDILKD